MSESADDDRGTARKALDTVTPPSMPKPNAEMSTIGWAMFLGLVLVLMPLLPFLLIVWVLSKLIDTADPRT
jgi:hypothetical protein